MIPRTFPSTLDSVTGVRSMVVYFLPSVTGLQRWIDYIPVSWSTAANQKHSSYDANGYISVDSSAVITGKQAWVDYVPVYLDPNAAGAWNVSLTGFVPIGGNNVVAQLFNNGEPGAVFIAQKPSEWGSNPDLVTMFQDAAGTTPVTALEQKVGLHLDVKPIFKFPDGTSNPAPNTVGQPARSVDILTDKSTLAASGTRVAMAAAYVKNQSFEIKGANGLSWNDGVASTAITSNRVIVRCAPTATQIAIFNQTAGALSLAGVTITWLYGAHRSQSSAAAQARLSARYNLFAGSDTLSTQTVTTMANTYRLYFTGTGSITLSGTATGTFTAGSNTITCTAGALTATVTGSVTTADLRLSCYTYLPVYQRTTDATTGYDDTGFPARLVYSGAQGYATGSVDFSTLNQAQTFVGLGMLSYGATAGCVLEYGPTVGVGSPGFNTFTFAASSSIRTGAAAGGSAGANADVAQAVPSAFVVTGLSDMTGAGQATTRVNSGGAVTASSGGTGTFTPVQPLYSGSRGGTGATFPLTGDEFISIVRGGSMAPTDPRIVSVEQYCRQKMLLSF